MAIGAAGLAAFKNADMGDEGEDIEQLDEMESPEEEVSEEDAAEVVDEEGFSDFVDALYDAAADVEAAATDIPDELGHDSMPSEDALAKIKSQVAEMPAVIQDGIEDFIKGMAWENVEGIAEGMEEAGLIEATDAVTGWLYWAAKAAEGTASHEAGESAEEEAAEHDEDADVEMDADDDMGDDESY